MQTNDSVLQEHAPPAHHVPGLSFPPERIAARRATLGASEMPVLAGANPYKSPLTLWLEKRGLAPAFDGNEATEWGTRLEALVAEKYAEVRRCRIALSDTLVHPVEAWLSATPDRIVDDGERGLEVKCRGAFRAYEWGEPGTDEVPDDVAIQCHVNMAVTGARRWDVAALFGGNRFAIYELVYSEDIAEALIAIGREFWFSYVIPGVQPPIDGSLATQKVLRDRFPSHRSDELREATPEECAWIASLKEAREEAKHIEAREDELKNHLMAAIGDGAGLQSPIGKVTWKSPATGAPRWKDVALALAKQQGVPSSVVESLCAEYMTPPSRKFLPSFPKAR